MADPAGSIRGGGIIFGDEVISKQELAHRGKCAASGFAAQGIVPGATVALLLRNDPVFFEASRGASTLGAFPVPINWHSSVDEVLYVIEDCGAALLVVHADLYSKIASKLPSNIQVIVVRTPDPIREAFGLEALACAVPAGAEAWNEFVDGHEAWSGPKVRSPGSMIYTSGTTGHPKGVRRTPPIGDYTEILEQINQATQAHVPGMRSVLTGPLYHSAPNAYGLGALRVGGILHIVPRFDAEGLLRLIEAEQITNLTMVPTMFVRLLRLPKPTRDRYDVSSLVRVSHAAAPCPPDIKRAMIDWWGPIIVEYYGGTESGVVAACSSREWLEHPGTVGRPVAGATIRIHADDGKEVAQGEIGEVYMIQQSYGRFRYHGREDDPDADDRGGLISCGDIGYLDPDGFLHLCDRKRDVVISGGVNLYPAEIESVLLAHPSVRDCAVIGVPDEEFGESLLALVEKQSDAEPITADGLRAFLRERLAHMKVPKMIEFRANLPREDSGKIFKRKLREPYWEGRDRAI